MTGKKMEGRHVVLVPLVPSVHAGAIYIASHGPSRSHIWQYMREGPFSNAEDFRNHLEGFFTSEKFIPFAIIDSRSGAVAGMINLMRHDPAHRTIEIGYVLMLPSLQGSCGATEALYLVMRHAMETMNCRRCEWRCDSENNPSQRAATRLGFKLEGRLRQHLLVKGRNRDTLVLSLLDSEWPDRKRALEDWLKVDNFDETGRQIVPLRR